MFANYCEARKRLDMAHVDCDAEVTKDNEDVMLNPEVFAQVCNDLRFHLSVDLFATAQHHQAERYMVSVDAP